MLFKYAAVFVHHNLLISGCLSQFVMLRAILDSTIRVQDALLCSRMECAAKCGTDIGCEKFGYSHATRLCYISGGSYGNDTPIADGMMVYKKPTKAGDIKVCLDRVKHTLYIYKLIRKKKKPDMYVLYRY